MEHDKKQTTIISNDGMPFFYFPLIGKINTTVKITPRMYTIDQNVVRDNILRTGKFGLFPEKESNEYDTNQRRLLHATKFDMDPLYYLVINHKIIYGISTYEIKKIYNKEMEKNNEKEKEKEKEKKGNNNNNNNNNNNSNNNNKKELKTNSITNVLNSILLAMEHIYNRKFSLDEVFPKTKIKIARENIDNYHKSDSQILRKRVIPIYILPYWVKSKVFSKIPKLVEDVEHFIQRLKNFIDVNPISMYYYDSYLQLKSNLTFALRDQELSASKLKLQLIGYQKELHTLQEENITMQEDNIKFKRKISEEVEIIIKENKKLKKSLKRTKKKMKNLSKNTSNLNK